jgi:polyisoprenoid-binding protein YceI
MKKRSLIRQAVAIGGAALVLACSTLGVTAYNYLKPTAAASAPIASVALAAPQTSSGTVYQLQSSQARFIVDEVLRGSPFTVVGATDQVAGQLAVDTSNTSTAQLGTILIDARTLATDDSSRNRALGNQILDTNQYEYISFTPTAISGLPAQLTVGESYAVQLSGDLTIKDVTRPTVFDVTVTPTADGGLAGTATSTIQYAGWGVSIPSVPFVASVDNQVTLQLDFMASAEA